MAYDESYFRARESWRDWRIEASELIRAAQICNGSTVLEIGCGGGGLLRMLREREAWVVGIDTLEAALKLAQKRLDAEERGETRRNENKTRKAANCGVGLIRIGKDSTLPFSDASFDVIIGQHVIEHLSDASAALHEWRRLLKPTGRLALATPNARYPDPAHFADADHAHIFTALELRHIVEQAGFIVESCFTIFPFLTRFRLLRAAGVIAYGVFRLAPYFSSRGRTIMLAARKA